MMMMDQCSKIQRDRGQQYQYLLDTLDPVHMELGLLYHWDNNFQQDKLPAVWYLDSKTLLCRDSLNQSLEGKRIPAYIPQYLIHLSSNILLDNLTEQLIHQDIEILDRMV